MKKFLLLCLVLVGYVGTASADYYVVGALTDWTYEPSKNDATAMTSSSTEGLYYFDCTPDAGGYYFHIADGDGTDWSDYHSNHRYSAEEANKETAGGVYSESLGNHGEQNLLLTADGTTTYRIILDATNSSDLKLTVTKLNQNYVVAGAFRHDLTNDYSVNPIFTDNWDVNSSTNVLTVQEDGTYAKTYTGVVLPVGGDIVYKIVKDNNWETATSSDQVYRVYTAGTYDVTITLYINNLDGPVINVTETASGSDFFLLSGNGDWKVSDEAMVDNGDNSYSKTFVNSKGYNFIIAPKAAIASTMSWNDCVRPNSNVTVNFENYEETKYQYDNGSQNWTINTDESVTLTYNSSTGIWSINCAPRTAIIGEAGYITYSNSEKCTISGATPYTISMDNGATVHMQPWDSETVWPENEGMIIKKTSGSTVTIYPVANNADATDVGTNYLVGTGNNAQNITATDYTYVLANGGSGVGFYLAEGDGELAAHKAYLDLDKYNEKPDAARMFLGFNFDDEATGISEAKAAKNDGVIYNLQGIRMSQMQKGLNIVNGKKVMVK